MMNKRLMFLSVVMVSAMAVSSISCNNKKEAAVKGGDSGPVLAKINNTEITLSDFNERLKEYPSVAHGGTLDIETKKGFLDNLIVRELLYQEAVKAGLDKEKETAEILEEMKKRILVEKFFKKELEQNLIKKKKKEKFDSLVAGLKSKASITIKEELLTQ